MAIKIKKILEAGKVVYPATILDAVKDATATIDGKANGNYGKTLRLILASLASDASAKAEAEVKALSDKLYVGTPAEGEVGTDDYKPAVKGDIVAINDRLDVIEGEGEGSVKKAATDATASAIAQLISDSEENPISDKFDTLKEIADWILASDKNAESLKAGERLNALETAVGVPASGEGENAVTATGLYKEIANAVASANSAIEGLDVEETTVKNAEADEVVSFKYNEEDGIVTISDLNVVTSTLGEVGLSQGEDGKWAEGTANTAKGLATAADVAAELVNDEKVIAAALNNHEERVAAIEAKFEGDESVDAKIEAEKTRAEGAESNLLDAIDTEEAARKALIGELGKVSTEEGAADHTVKSYVDFHFSTEACSDTTDYADVF